MWGQDKSVRAMLEANPWAYNIDFQSVFGRPTDSYSAEAMSTRKLACLERLGSGHEAWAVWGASMARLEPRSWPVGVPRKLWEWLSAVDFSDHVFTDLVDLSAVLFPGNVSFDQAVFQEDVFFNASIFCGSVSFASCRFNRRFSIEAVQFEHECVLSGLSCVRAVEARKAAFRRNLIAKNIQLFDDVWMVGSKFEGSVNFSGSEFGGEAGFGSCLFLGPVGFEDAKFSGGAGFEGAEFLKSLSFGRATFSKRIWTKNAKFRSGPVFDRARVFNKQSLDDILSIPTSSYKDVSSQPFLTRVMH